jgi:putative redox protein
VDTDLGSYRSSDEPVVNKATLTWERERVFTSTTPRGYDLEFDAANEWGCMPVEALLMSLGGCLAIDVVTILQKMRCPPTKFSIDMEGERTAKPPQRYTRFRMVLHLAGEGITEDKVRHAIELSETKYCSVHHSLREDIEVEVDFELEA